VNRPRTFSIRATLISMAVVGVVYVLGLSFEIAAVLAPAAGVLRRQASDLLADHDAIRMRLEGMRLTLDDLEAVFRRLNTSHTALPVQDALRLAAPTRARLDSVVAMRPSLAQAQVPAEMRLRLAEAVESETAAGLSILDAVRAMEAGRRDDAGAALQTANTLLNATGRQLSAAQGVAITDLLRRGDALLRDTHRVTRWAVAWAGLGVLLLLSAMWLVRSRLYGPLGALEGAVTRVAGGDLSADLHVPRNDELGRLATHFNQMTAVLRMRAEHESRRHENLTERFGRILDESSSEIYLFDASTLRFVQANRGARANLGYTTEELSGLTPPDILRDLSRTSFEAALHALRHGDQPRMLLSANQVRKDGSSYPVEITLQLSSTGEPPVFVAVVEDVSARSRVRELNERLRQFALTEHRLIGGTDLPAALRAIAEMAAEALRVKESGVWLFAEGVLRAADRFDRETREHASGQEIPTASLQSFLGALNREGLIAAPDAMHDPRTAELVNNPLCTPEVTSRLAAPVRAGGRILGLMSFAHTGEPRRWSAEEQAFAGSVADLVALALESSERNRLENQLAQSQKMDSIGRLAGGVAHDFNNLLTAMLGNLEFAKAGLSPNDPLLVELEEIEKAAHRATELTRQLLTFARRQVVQPVVADLNALTRGADKLLRRLIGEDIELVTLLESDRTTVRIDPSQFEQVIVNLAVNARDAMPEGGRLLLETRNVFLDQEFADSHPGAVPGHHVQLAVSDNGVGMDRETLRRLFEPFFTTKGPGQGTGLGLAICYGIVRQAGGNIWAYSEPGLGSTFKVHLPLLDDLPEALKPVAEAKPVPGGHETILLAEDEAQIRDLIVRTLSQRGYTVLATPNGEEALGVAREKLSQIDALITDVVLPLVGGQELATKLRLLRPGLPVVFISGYTAGAVPDRDLQGDSTVFLPKPFTPKDLAHRLREVLDGIKGAAEDARG
jgi:PAS domain S-box-containing protein